jgi:glutamate--cysteine ligase
LSGPTPDTPESHARVTTKRQLVDYIASGEKPPEQWKIGTEHEKFPFLNDTLAPVPYDGPRSIRALLEGLRDRFGWDGVYEGDNIIALSDPHGLGSISLEPGGQFELSGAPLSTIHETCDEVHNHLAQVREVGDAIGIGFLGLGSSPIWTRAETPVMPKGRYAIMAPYMDKKGKLGRDMMFRTSTVQVNLDFSSEADMVKKLRVSLSLQPVATALFANSPFTEGKPNGYKSFRSAVWLDTDPDRSGMLPFAFEPGMGYERYVDYALDVPMYFVYRDGKYIDVSGKCFRDFLEGRIPELKGVQPSMSDWADHLTTIFPEARLKTFLEMRGADGGSWRRICGLPALWVGLYYDQAALDAAWDMVKDWSAEERQAMRDTVARLAFDTPFRGRSVGDLAHEMLEISAAGLRRRAAQDSGGTNEEGFLHPLMELVDKRQTRAGQLLERYHGEWKGDLAPLFTEYNFL